MAELVPGLTSSEDGSGDEEMTDSDVDVMEATSEYGSGEQQHVSDGREEEASDGSDNMMERRTKMTTTEKQAKLWRMPLQRRTVTQCERKATLCS